MPVDQLHVGDPIFSTDRTGHRIVTVVRAVGATGVPASHKLVRLRLSDGRVVSASPGHPLASGRFFSDVTAGDVVDRSTVTSTERVAFASGDRTYDVLPDGDTGTYWADGVLVRSTLR